jgi:hypothetical protein
MSPSRKKHAAAPVFYEDKDRLYHDIGDGVLFSMGKGDRADAYKAQVEGEHGFVGSTAPSSPEGHYGLRAGKALSRTLDSLNPGRARYRSLKDLIFRRPDPNYRPGSEVLPIQAENVSDEMNRTTHSLNKSASLAEYSVLFDHIDSGDLGSHVKQALIGVCEAITSPLQSPHAKVASSPMQMTESQARQARLDQLLRKF